MTYYKVTKPSGASFHTGRIWTKCSAVAYDLAVLTNWKWLRRLEAWMWHRVEDV